MEKQNYNDSGPNQINSKATNNHMEHTKNRKEKMKFSQEKTA